MAGIKTVLRSLAINFDTGAIAASVAREFRNDAGGVEHAMPIPSAIVLPMLDADRELVVAIDLIIQRHMTRLSSEPIEIPALVDIFDARIEENERHAAAVAERAARDTLAEANDRDHVGSSAKSPRTARKSPAKPRITHESKKAKARRTARPSPKGKRGRSSK